jgi:diaminohydroxyphosphoribosylaminopyrimidine deaminase/5-amino-6-(5-phosphoribosylamino)uracil reductase
MSAEILDAWLMERALALAAHGVGHVEPNPPVGCVIARGAEIIAEGWHRRFGGPHAEIEALRVAGDRARGATLVVTLEPCCHQGKTPPCTEAIKAAGIARVVYCCSDPFPAVSGKSLGEMEQAGIEVRGGVLADAGTRLLAPYLKLVTQGRPWVIAKWAMSLDGKLATRTGDSRWISGEESRKHAHLVRAQSDAIVVGRGTVTTDDPLLTARPAGPRVATRIVLTSRGEIPPESQLVRTAREAPVLIFSRQPIKAAQRSELLAAGCEVFETATGSARDGLIDLLNELGKRRATRVLVEGGSNTLGRFFDASLVDEVQVYVAPRVIGGQDATLAVGGLGIERMSGAIPLQWIEQKSLGADLFLRGLVVR